MKTYRTALQALIFFTFFIFFEMVFQQVSPVHAATITVTTTVDELNSDGDCSLREAIQAANTNSAVDACIAGSAVDVINLLAGTYTILLTNASGDEDINATGDFDIQADLTINAPGPNQTIIDGNGGVIGDRVFEIFNGAQVSFNGLTILNGNVVGNGGGIEIRDSSLTTQNVFITENTAGVDGGGVYSTGSSGSSIYILNSSIVDNVTTTGRGGGIRTGSNDSLTILNSTIANNTVSAANRQGGGIYSGGALEVRNTTISGNVAGNFGGGVTFAAAAVGANMTLANNTFYGNSATTNGGGIHNTSSNTASVANTILHQNTPNNCIGPLSGSNNLVSDATCVGNLGTVTNFDTNLAENGGLNQTHALFAGSNAIDVVSNSLCDSASSIGGVDQRGAGRNFDGDSLGDSGTECDIGALEYRPVAQNCTLSTGTPLTVGNLSFTITSLGSLNCLFIEEMNANHLAATGSTGNHGISTGNWWHVYGEDILGNRVTSGFDLAMTLPYATADANSRVCKYPGNLGGAGWDCDDGTNTSYVANTSVTRSGIISFSDFAAGDTVDPTAVSLQATDTASGTPLVLVAALVGLLGVTTASVFRRRLR